MRTIDIRPEYPFDLSATLPPLTKKGGKFAISAGSLPSGVTMTESGLLSGGTKGTRVIGVIFEYTEP